MLKIKETYLSNLKNVYCEEDIYLIITQYPPEYNFKEDNILIIKDLAPNKDLFYLAKHKLINYEEYKYLYLQQLINKKTDKYFYERLKLFNKTIWLVCYCKEKNKCHRRILGTHMSEKFGITYEEEK